MRQRPTAQFRLFAYELIEVGVDILHGHSAHICQGIEIYKNGIILYDTGDFVDDYAADPYLRNDLSFFFIIEADAQGPKALRMIPSQIAAFQVNHARGVDQKNLLEKMLLLSKELAADLQIESNTLFIRLK